jgi:thioredoxin 1
MSMMKLQSHITPTLDSTSESTSWVVCLCADWCRACKGYRSVFSQLAEEVAEKYPDSRFVWIDVEDQADLVGDLEIETFPTLLVGSAEGLNFLGAITPQPQVLSRLLNSLLESDALRMAHRPATKRIIDQLAVLPALCLQAELLHR